MRTLVLALLALVSAAPLLAQSWITGRVFETDERGRQTPVPDIYVLAKGGSPPDILARALSGPDGRFHLSGLPAGRMEISIHSPGYYALRAADLQAETVVRTCPRTGPCGTIDFEVAPTAVLRGRLTDSFGDPAPSRRLLLEQEGGRSWSAKSDDRGRFRFWGLRPGRYRLDSQPAHRGVTGPPALSREIEISPGERDVQLHWTVEDDSPTYTIAGRVAGVEGNRSSIAISPFEEGRQHAWMTAVGMRDGRFSISNVPAGRYLLRIPNFPPPSSGGTLLGLIDVDRDQTDLVLHPQPPTGVQGRVHFGDSTPRGARLTVSPVDMELSRPETLRANPPDYRFQHTGLPPGEYRVGVRSRDYFIVGDDTFLVTPGRMTRFEIKLSDQFATVRGRVRLPGEERLTASNFTVGLRGPGSPLAVRSDDQGRFIFRRVVPGDYQIAAWQTPGVDVHDDDVWRRAGPNVRRIQIEPGFEVEVDLTVTE